MPTYAYLCQDCGVAFEKRMSMAAYSAGDPPSCPNCGSADAERSFVTVNVLTGSRGNGAAGRCGPTGFG